MKTSTHIWRRDTVVTGFCLTGVVFLAGTSLGEGFRNSTIGASQLGRSGGRIAQLDDPTAVQYNPANLINSTNLAVSAQPTVDYVSSEFTSAQPGQKVGSQNAWKFLPNAFFSTPLDGEKIAVGFGMTVPYGLGNEWDKNSSAFAPSPTSLRYQTPYYSELVTINLNPSISFRLCDCVSIGIGADAMWSNLKLKQYYPTQFLPGGISESDLQAEGDGWGWGGNVALTWNITDHQRLAFTYRSPMNVNYSGNANINYVSPTEALFGVTPSSSFNSQIKFPTIVGAGYGIDVNDRLRLETDFEWLEFSRFKSLPLNLGNNAALFSLVNQPTTTPENWHNTFTLGVGGDYRLTDHWILRASYQFFESPVPDSTFSPTIPDANQNVITLGVGWNSGHHSLELGYGLDFYSDRHISSNQNPYFNGTYTFNVHLFSVGYTYTF